MSTVTISVVGVAPGHRSCGRTLAEDVQLVRTALSKVIIAVANYPRPRCDGHSFAVDAAGKILVLADEEPGLVVATFDLLALRGLRREDAFRWSSRPATTDPEC